MKKWNGSNSFAAQGKKRMVGNKVAKQSQAASLLDKLSRDPTSRYTLIGVVVVLFSILYGKFTKSSVLDTSLRRLLSLSCESGFCMKDLVSAVDRKLVAGRRLEQGWKLVEMPRSMQIWTLDALRDPFVKKNLFGARHLKTHRPLTSKAFLAAYIALLQASERGKSHDDATRILRDVYLGLLPKHDDFKSYHPLTFDLRELNSKFGAYTYFYFLVSRRKAEIESEYKAFSHVSSIFQEKVTFEDYRTARLCVQTRAFQSGPLDGLDASIEELDLYKKHLGIDLIEGSTAMVVLMDAMNAHHEEHNVQYKYIPESKKFYLYAMKDIQAGDELYISYGDRADLYSTYGFVNGDFSERTAALLALHQIVDRRVVSQQKHEAEQKKQIQRYLQYDDGYSTCVADDDTDAMEFKRLKRRLLLLIVNDYRKWSASLPRRDRDPGSTSVPIDDGVNPLISTCRLLAMTHHDYEGTATNLLKAKIREVEEAQRLAPEDYHGESYNLVFKRSGRGLEYRAGIWLYRLAAESLKRWGALTSADEFDKLQTFTPNSRDWTASYVRYQELQTLETLKLYAEHVVRQFSDVNGEDIHPDDMFYRNDLCPISSPELFDLHNE